MRLIQSGPKDARIMIVGEAPGREEAQSGQPFIGPSGSELNRLLLEAGINRRECFITNVCHAQAHKNDIELFFHTKTEAKSLGLEVFWGRYPNQTVRDGVAQLLRDVNEVKPKLIIALGNTPLWALTGKTGIMSWRGSALSCDAGGLAIPLLPTIHPANILRDFSNRYLALQDLRRAVNFFGDRTCWYEPTRAFTIRPTLDNVSKFIQNLLFAMSLSPTTIACDIETRQGQIACIGIATDKTNAICIPLLCVERPEGYWNEHEELLLWTLLRQLLTHPNARCIFHNGAYDLQYFAKQMGFMPRIAHDTMLMQHVAFPGLRKSLAVCASLYCTYHRYWKDDGKEWDKTLPEEQLWTYNCTDCVRTYEIWEELTKVLTSLNLVEQYTFQIEELFPTILEMMLRGVTIDLDYRASLDQGLSHKLNQIEQWLTIATGHPLNPRSPTKIKQLLYEDLGLPVIRKRATGLPTTDDEALEKIKLRYPLIRPLCDKILEARSVGVFLNTFVHARVPPDGRMRTTYNLAGTETFRFSSSEDSFGYGTNLQNIPKGNE